MPLVLEKPVSRNFSSPDETRPFEKGKGKMDVLKIDDMAVGRFRFEPGWRWSEHVKPIAKTDLCEVSHFIYQTSGRMHIKMADGYEFEVGPGALMRLPAGHDGWVVGDEAVEGIDFEGAMHYAE